MTSKKKPPTNTSVAVFSASLIILFLIGFIVVLCVKLDLFLWDTKSRYDHSDADYSSLRNYNEAVPYYFENVLQPQNLIVLNDATRANKVENINGQKVLVHPVKIFPDIGEGVEQAETLDKHYFGNFRPNKAKIWDPNPEYEFNAFGRHFHLILNHDSGEFVHPAFKVITMSKNFSIQQEPDVNPRGCYYSGVLQNHTQSNVVVSLCNGMTGHIYSENGSYFIKPAGQFDENVDILPHILYRFDYQNSDHETHCEVLESEEHTTLLEDKIFNNTREDEDESKVFRSRGRNKRSSTMEENVVQLMIAVDKNMAEFHGSELHNYIFTIMSMVAKIFKDKSIGNSVNLTVVKFVILRDNDIINVWSTDEKMILTKTLDSFCTWQQNHNNKNEMSNDHHDCAILILREITCTSKGTTKCYDKLGLAGVGKMCQEKCCVLVRDNGMHTAFTVAHELGHSFNMVHDEDEMCQPFIEKGSKKGVMAKVLDAETYPWEWSTCSRHYITEYLETGNDDCLHNDPPIRFSSNDDQLLPGEKYTRDKQCELIYGKGYKNCANSDNCSRLWCVGNVSRNVGCQSNGMPVAEGTPCDSGFWCRRGECVLKNRQALKSVDGGWGPYKPYGECSRSCGGGIQRASRACDSPPPKNEGKYCVGKHLLFQSCNIKECPYETLDFRSQQCAEFNNHYKEIEGVNKTRRWFPFYGFQDKHKKCMLFCKAENTSPFRLQDKVIDGTPCGLNTYDMCVNGKCQSAGCDHILGSNSVLDACGICGGKNTTCKQVYKNFNISRPIFGLNDVTTIPAGAFNIDVEQRGFDHKPDENYLTLVDAENKKYLLNGKNSSLQLHPKEIEYDGIVLNYSGSNITIERINASQPLRKDLILKVHSVGNLSPPYIVCRYIVPTSPEEYFKWDVTDMWTACSKVCHGQEEQIIRCVRKDTNNHTSKQSCSGLFKPTVRIRSCNQHCNLRWDIVSQTECSSFCGLGFRLLIYRCFQEFVDKLYNRAELPDTSCAHIDKPAENQTCVGLCYDYRWKYHEWQTCSVTCGNGIQTRKAVCVDEFEKIVDDSKCATVEKIIQSRCIMRKCSFWSTSEWSSCSTTCGIGEKKRGVRCQQGNEVVSSQMCSSYAKPAAVESCQRAPCATWVIGEWSDCTTTCGIGEKTRLVRCSAHDENLCQNSLKPSAVEICFISLCNTSATTELTNFTITTTTTNTITPTNVVPSNSWGTGRWGECSASCGGGRKIRRVICRDEYGNEATNCDATSKPSSAIPCNMEPCSQNYYWKYGEWSECSVTCGLGFQKRVVECRRVAELEDEKMIVSHDFCDDRSRPPTQRECNLNVCANYYIWVPGVWGECNATCGRKGKQKRKLSCFHRNGRKVKKSYCKLKRKPSRKRKCTSNKCEPTSCLELKREFKTSVDRDYSFNILGRNISIYCFRMWSDSPTEYLTLPTGEKDNFSEFFGKRLINPDSCPENRRSKHNCPCVEETNAKSGKTTFSKIRLNLTSLQVITKDFTFAKQVIGSAVPFGEAGDCYSTASCPQGAFSINLKGTGLRISPTTSWIKDGVNASMSVELFNDNRRVVGKCGGYCAACRPLAGLKLDVLPP